MSYTAKQIDRMSIDELESLANMLTFEDRMTWSGSGYDGATFIELIKK
jgi:hypothetical protein